MRYRKPLAPPGLQRPADRHNPWGYFFETKGKSSEKIRCISEQGRIRYAARVERTGYDARGGAGYDGYVFLNACHFFYR